MWKDEALLLDILIAAKKARSFTLGKSWSDFTKDEVLQSALVHVLIVMGEAASKISDETKTAHKELPWRDMISMRNMLVHEYFRIDLDEVWSTVQNDLPKVISIIEPLIPPEE